MAPTIKIFHPITPLHVPVPKDKLLKKFLFWSFLSLLLVVCIWVHTRQGACVVRGQLPLSPSVMTGPQVWQQIHTVFPTEPPQSFPVKLFRGRVL